jgi:hypothetical protein
MEKRGTWTWNKDAEFWFNDAYGEVSGGLFHSVEPYAVWFDLTGGIRSAARLLATMRTLRAELPEYELHMPVPSQSDTRQLLDELAAAGSIKWQEIRHSNSREARITHVTPPAMQPSVEQASPKKPWWRFW